MSVTDVGWAPRGTLKTKKKHDALAWKGVAIATLSVEQRWARLGSLISRGHSYCRYYSMQELFTNHRPAQQNHPLT